MNEWEMRYRALAMGVTQEYIDDAEKLVLASIDLATKTGVSVNDAFDMLIWGVISLQGIPKFRPQTDTHKGA